MPSIADLLGERYRLVRLLGRGGMSDVYEATDEDTGATVAVKVVRSGDPEFVRRLTQEARALERFEHPGLIQLLDTGLAGDDAYLVMAYIDGPTLAQFLQNGPLGARETGHLGSRLADTLAYVHERGVVHRDVKPSNILLSSSGDAWIGDFGIAQLQDATTLTAAGTTMGTVVYMAPEQLEGHQVGPSADVWSLAMVLLECLTGKRVYEGRPSEIMALRLSGPVPVPADLPAPWKLVLSGMLEHDPEQRLSAAQVSSLLASAAYETPWIPSNSDETVRLDTRSPYDATSMMPGVVAAAMVTGDETVIDKPAQRMAPPRRRQNWWKAPSGFVAVAAILIVLFFWLWRGPSNVVSTTTTSSTSTTQHSTTTSTLASGSPAFSTLASDLANGQSAGGIDPGSVHAITQQAQQALTDAAAGNTIQAANDLQRASTTITNATQSGQVASSEAALLQSDLSALAAELGVIAPSTTTTTVAPPGGGPGNGKGHGHNH